MILHRFCSSAEYDAFMRGEVLKNNTDHGARRGYSVTSSIGFCFFSEDPEDAIHWLSGIVDLDYCLTFDIPDEMLSMSSARYRDVSTPLDASGVCLRRDFWLRRYSADTVKLLYAVTSFRGYAPNASTLRKLYPLFFL